ncbi:MAG: hypothetical protein LIR46_12495, partial [Bacteroidota bacterium]|nr:hypothetical protein [Bacteroidota bacterium]
NGTLKNAEGSKRYQILPGDILIFDNTNASIFNTSAKNMIRPQNLVANITSFFMLFILVNILLSFYILNRQGRYSK